MIPKPHDLGFCFIAVAFTDLLCSDLTLPVQSAIITYDFVVDIDSGLLLGNSYSGFFRYDNNLVTKGGLGVLRPDQK